MKENNWNFTLPESFLKTMEELNKVQLSASALAACQAWKVTVPNYNLKGITTALEQYAAATKGLSNVTLPTSSILGVTDVINAMHTIKMSSVAASVLPLIDTSVYAALVDTAGITAALTSIDWSWIAEMQGREMEAEVQPVVEELITSEIRSEIAADITQVLSDPEHIEAVSRSKYLEWKARNPGLAALFLEILYPFLLMLIPLCVSIWLARPVKDSQVYKKPTSTSNVVYNLTVDNNVTIIGDVPYYYKIEFVHPETGELVTGYIYKGNVAAEESEETEAQVEETEATEESDPTVVATESQTEPSE